jgi:hypothetical protein
MKKLAILAAASLLAALSGTADANAQARERFECDAEGAGDISMSARYEVRGARERFSTEFEAAPGGAFEAGDRIAVMVKTVQVGTVRLRPTRGGDLVADLNLGDDSARPIPDDFPVVRAGTRVRVTMNGRLVLGCRLVED